MVEVLFDWFVVLDSTLTFLMFHGLAILFCDFEKLQNKVSHGKKKYLCNVGASQWLRRMELRVKIRTPLLFLVS